MSTQLGISEHLRAECERVYPDSVTVSHGMRAVGGNVCAGEVTLEASSGEQCSRRFDMIVGADGVTSVVRGLMLKQVRHEFGRVHALPAALDMFSMHAVEAYMASARGRSPAQPRSRLLCSCVRCVGRIGCACLVYHTKRVITPRLGHWYCSVICKMADASGWFSCSLGGARILPFRPRSSCSSPAGGSGHMCQSTVTGGHWQGKRLLKARQPGSYAQGGHTPPILPGRPHSPLPTHHAQRTYGGSCPVAVA